MEFDFQDWFLKFMQKKQNILWRKQGILWTYEPHLHVQDVNYKARNKTELRARISTMILLFLLWYFFLGNFFHPKLLPTPNTSTYTILSKQILVCTLDRTSSSSVNRGRSLTWHAVMACLLVVLVTNRYPLHSFWILFSLQIFSRCPPFQRPFPIKSPNPFIVFILNSGFWMVPPILSQTGTEFFTQWIWKSVLLNDTRNSL